MESGRVDSHAEKMREALVERIIALAQHGERDVGRLCESELLAALPESSRRQARGTL
jgi:hypothetical protein